MRMPASRYSGLIFDLGTRVRSLPRLPVGPRSALARNLPSQRTRPRRWSEVRRSPQSLSQAWERLGEGWHRTNGSIASASPAAPVAPLVITYRPPSHVVCRMSSCPAPREYLQLWGHKKPSHNPDSPATITVSANGAQEVETALARDLLDASLGRFAATPTG